MPGSDGGLNAYTEDRIRDWQDRGVNVNRAHAEWVAMGWTASLPLFTRWWNLVVKARKVESCQT